MNNKDCKPIIKTINLNHLSEETKQILKEIMIRLGWVLIPGFEETDGTLVIEMPQLDAEKENKIFEILFHDLI